jgi:hypothetical protein
MTKYEQQKKKLRNKINKFDLSDDLTHLADADAVTKDILDKEKFPIKKYWEFKSKK